MLSASLNKIFSSFLRSFLLLLKPLKVVYETMTPLTLILCSDSGSFGTVAGIGRVSTESCQIA